MCPTPSFVENYEYMVGLQWLDAYQAWGPSNSIFIWLNGMVTPLRWERREQALANHPDHQYTYYTVSGISNGFHTSFEYSKYCRNMRLENQKPMVVLDYLLTECSSSRVVGPTSPENFSSRYTKS